jgi:hypothetical protein
LSKRKRQTKSWWSRYKIKVSNHVKAELKQLRATLTSEEEMDSVWCRPIGLLIPRGVNVTPIADASYEGLGGYCRAASFMWRLSADDLRSCGWKISGDNEASKNLFNPKTAEDEAHINILEFVAIIINAWILLKIKRRAAEEHNFFDSSRHIIARFLGDNTSALSWLRHASRTKRTAVRNLARLLTGLFLSCNIPIQVSELHIPGTTNVEADKLSRFSDHPSWASLMRDGSLDYQSLQAYQVPRKLLTIIWSTASQTKIADTSEQTMIRLWRAELKPLPPGWENSVSTTSL